MTPVVGDYVLTAENLLTGSLAATPTGSSSTSSETSIWHSELQPRAVLYQCPERATRRAPPRQRASGLTPTGRWLSLWLIHCRSRRFTGVRGPAVRAGHEHWRTVVNAKAQYSKACEGANLPWVQIPPPPPPPPPPLTCKNTGPSGRQAGVSCSLVSFIGLNYERRAVRPPGSATAVVPSHGCPEPA